MLDPPTGMWESRHVKMQNKSVGLPRRLGLSVIVLHRSHQHLGNSRAYTKLKVSRIRIIHSKVNDWIRTQNRFRNKIKNGRSYQEFSKEMISELPYQIG